MKRPGTVRLFGARPVVSEVVAVGLPQALPARPRLTVWNINPSTSRPVRPRLDPDCRNKNHDNPTKLYDLLRRKPVPVHVIANDQVNIESELIECQWMDHATTTCALQFGHSMYRYESVLPV
jgi:hypothetical protein